MSRLTEYHCGVAVIKDKSKLKEAMAKLARFEDLEDKKNRYIEKLEEVVDLQDKVIKIQDEIIELHKEDNIKYKLAKVWKKLFVLKKQYKTKGQVD